MCVSVCVSVCVIFVTSTCSTYPTRFVPDTCPCVCVCGVLCMYLSLSLSVLSVSLFTLTSLTSHTCHVLYAMPCLCLTTQLFLPVDKSMYQKSRCCKGLGACPDWTRPARGDYHTRTSRTTHQHCSGPSTTTNPWVQAKEKYPEKFPNALLYPRAVFL